MGGKKKKKGGKLSVWCKIKTSKVLKCHYHNQCIYKKDFEFLLV